VKHTNTQIHRYHRNRDSDQRGETKKRASARDGERDRERGKEPKREGGVERHRRGEREKTGGGNMEKNLSVCERDTARKGESETQKLSRLTNVNHVILQILNR